MSALKDRLRDYALGNTSSEEKTMNDGSGSALRNRMAEIAYSDDEKKTDPHIDRIDSTSPADSVKYVDKPWDSFNKKLEETRNERSEYIKAAQSGRNPMRGIYSFGADAKPATKDDYVAAGNALSEKVIAGTATDSDYRKYVDTEANYLDGEYKNFIGKLDSGSDVTFDVKTWNSYDEYKTAWKSLSADIDSAFGKYLSGTLSPEELKSLSYRKKLFAEKERLLFDDRYRLTGRDDVYGDMWIAYAANEKNKRKELENQRGDIWFEINNTVADDSSWDYLNGLRRSAEEIDAEIQASNDRYNLYESFFREDTYLPQLQQYEAVVNNDDFAEKSKFVKKDVTYTTLYDGSVFVSDDGAHRYNQINGDDSAKSVEATNRAIRDNGVSGGVYDESRRYEYLTDEQRGIFNYLYNTEGYDVALKYLDTLENYNDALRVQRIEVEKAEDIEYATKHPVTSSIWTLGQNYSSALPETIAMMPAFFGGEIDENSSAYRGTRQVQNIRGTVEENIDSGVGKFFYRHGMNLGDNVVRMAAGGGDKALSLAPALMQSFNSTALDAKARGLSDEQAVALGSIAAGAEYFFESESFEALMGGDVSESAWKYLVNNWKTEVAGEVSTDVVNDVADILISQDYSKWHAEANAYKAEGFSDREAWNMVFNDKLFGYLDTAAGSFFSSSAMAAPGTVRSVYNNYKVDVDKGRNLRFPDGSVLSHDDVADYVYRIADRGGSSEAVRFAQKLKKNIDDGKQVSSYQLGHLYSLAQNTPLFSDGDTGAVEETSVSSTVGDSENGITDLPSNVIESAANNAVNDTVQKISNETNTDSVSSDSVVDGVVKNIMEGGNGVDAIGFNQVAETDSDAVKAVDTVLSGKGTNTDYLRIASNQAARQKFFNKTGIRLSNNVDDSYNRIKDFADGILKVSEGKVSDEYAVPSYESIYNNEPSNENNGTALVDNTDSVNAAKPSAKEQLTYKLDAIGKSKGAKYEVLSVDWAKNGHDRTYLKLREIGADGKPKTYDYGYFDNVSGEYVPNKYRDINELAKNIPVNSENKVSDSENSSVETVKTEVEDDRTRVYNDLISRGVIKNDDDGNYVFNQNYKYDSNRKDANKTDFSIVVGNGRADGLHSETHSGTVIGGYGVSKSPDTGKYSVTHLQSGLSITSFDKQSDALQFASYVNDNVDYPIMRYRFGASVDRIYPTPADDASKNAINKLKEIKDGDAFKKESNNNAVVSLPLTNKKDTFAFLKTQIGKDVLVDGETRKLVSVSSKGFKTQNGSGDVITAEITGNTLEYTDDGFIIKYSDNAKVKYQFPDAVSVDNGSDVEYNDAQRKTEDKHHIRNENIGDVKKNTVADGISDIGDVKSYQISSYVMQKLTNGESITSKELFAEAERVYGGTLAEGVFTSKDAYDAMELGVNRYLLAQSDLTLDKVQKVLDLLPTQTNRTDSQVALQQFSTPPTLAYLANYAANVRPGETMLEPSAGIGGIALFAKHDGAEVYVNEYDKRRLGVLKNMPFDGFFNEDAEQLDNILGDKVNPSVVVMNPPFSSSEKRGMKGTDIGAKHISEALKVLADGGRLVAIVGQGMNDSAPAFRSWWKDIKEKYNVRANISIDGKLYKKYGTNFGIQMLVIDKTGNTDNTITESVDNLEELEKILGGIRDARPETNNTDSESRKQNSGTTARSETVEESELGLRRDTEASDDRNVSSTGGDTDAVGVQTGRTGRTDNKSVGTAETSSGENAGVQSDRRISDKRQDENRDRERRSSTEGNTSDDEGARSRTVGNDNGLRDDTGPLESDVGQSVQPVNERSESSRIKKTKKTELTDSIYEEYVPSKLPFKNAKKHPSKISESAAMSAIPSPAITYKPNLGDRVINDGVLSDVQLEAVCYAGQSHEQILEDGSRRGFFIGDGTGVGKGRTISGILLDNFNSGRKKAIWISMNDSLAKDASRDITALFGKDDMKFNFEGGKKAEKLKDTPNGIMFLTYGKLSQKFENDDSNFNRIVEWFGKDYDGVIVFDEAHKMANAEGKKGSRGMTKPSQTALAGIALQKALPKARIVYSSATGATDVRNLAYASRLGLWGKGTPFMNGTDFISKVTSGGIAAMELIARDLKSMGLYLSRNISYDGVKYEKLQHKLTKDQKQIYNTCAKAWQMVLQNVDKALKLTESDHKGGNRGNVQSAFWSSQQRFFNQIITSFQLPSVMDDIQKQLDEGKSCVIQLTSTNEAAQNREAERIKNDPELTLEDFDVSPKEMIIGFLEKSFPVEQYETQMDDRGNVISVPVKDSNGNAVLNREAVKIRDDLIDKLGLLSIPSSPIDQLINHFGEEMVAENTGRSRRIITKDGEKVEQKLSQAKRDADVSAFQEGKKRIIVFSEAGGTGKSYHADRSANNQQQRIHYLLEAGWKADAAVQGFGRSHRSNQAITPVFKLVTTDLRGQMRFISTIAKRLDSLGAMTKGQRQAGSQGMFDASDNLENSLANDVLSRFYRDLASNRVDDIENGLDIIGKLGITKDILDEYGRIKDTSPVLREMNKFLNRILTLEYSEQNAVFDAFAERLAEANRQAEENGTAERGLENYRADSITIKQAEVIKTDENTGAETLYYNLTVKNRIKPKLFDDINTSDKNFLGFYKNKNSGAVKAAYRTSDVTDAQGRVLHRYRLENPASSKEYVDMYRFYNWEKIDEAKARSEWNEALKNLPKFKESKLHLISGVILPVWDKLPTDSPRIYRVLTDNGEMLIGRSVSEGKIDEVLRRLGKNRTSDTYTSEQLTKELDSGNSIILDNGMNIKRRRVAGEWRYEISFGSSGSVSLLDDLKQKGVFSERVGGYVPRYFIPVNNISGILDYITSEISPVSRITEGDDINKRVSEYVAKSESTERNVNEWSASRDEENKADVKSISDIIKDIRDRFDIPINTGNYRGSHLGQFSERTESIRTRLANDLPTVSHELGHYLDKKYGLSKNESINEIIDFVPADVASRYSKEQLPGEAVAEFVKRYLTSRESARVDAPSFFKDFENVLDSVGQLDFIKALASDVNAYMSSDLDVRYSKSIETAREAKRKTRGSIAERVIEKAQSVYRTMVDDKVDIKSALKSAGEYDESKGTDNAYILATNAANAYQRANSNLTFALSDIDGNIIGKSLVERIMPVQKEIGAFNEYLKLKHALEWRRPNSKDIRAKQVFADPILDDPANIENQIKKFETKYPHFKEVSEDVYDFIDNIMYEYGVKSGLESEEVYDHLKKIYPHYVPFYRAVTKNGKAKGSFANQHSNFGYAKGSGLDTLPPLDNIVTLVNKVVASSVRNQAMNALAMVADTAEGFGNVMERVSPDMIRQTFDVTVQKSSLIDTLIENTNVDYNTLSDAINGIFDDTLNKFIPVAKGSKGIVTVRRGGANLYYQINDKDLYNAVASLSPTELKGFVKVASKINNFLKMGYTQYNPLFIVSNILRDFGTAWYNTDMNNFVTYVGCYFQALKEGITQSDNFKRYMAMGGGRSSELNAEKKDLNKTFEKLMKAKNRNPVIKVFATVFNPSALNNLIEVTPRFMEFKHQLNKTGDANTAMFKADDITTNFKRHGTNRSVNAVFMFSNAQIQGLDRLYRSFKDATPKQRTARIIKYCATALILEALLAWWNMKDDEEKESYENLSDYIKNNNYVVSVGDGRYIKIPKPREHAVLSSAVGRLAEWMFNGTEFDMVDFGGYIFDNLAPAFVPSDFSSPEAMLHSVLSNTFLGGIADVGFNLDYKGDPIVSAYDMYKDDRDQYSGGTSKVAVALGNALDYSPKKINYLIENYTGWFGSVLSSLDPMDESYKDQTLGFKGRYISDSRYSTDVFNDMYDNVSAAEKRVTDEERFADNHKASADAYAENETMQLLGDFTTQFRTSARNTLATEEEKRDAYFFSQQYIKGYDYTESEGLKFAKSLFEETGDDSVFITSMPITYDDEYSKDKVKYGMNLTPEQYMKLTNEYYDGIEKIRVDLSKLNISPERKVEEFAKRKREFTTNLRRKYVDEYGSRISE